MAVKTGRPPPLARDEAFQLHELAKIVAKLDRTQTTSAHFLGKLLTRLLRNNSTNLALVIFADVPRLIKTNIDEIVS